MLDWLIHPDELNDLIRRLFDRFLVVGPVFRDGHFFYDEIPRAGKVDLGFNYCVYSPRRWLFPPRDTLFTFKRENGSFVATPVADAQPTAIVGVHPCDLHAIALLDHVFAAEPGDEHYMARRRNLFLVGVDCAGPCTPGVFCGDMHTQSVTSGFDVMLYPLRTSVDAALRYGVVLGTDAGRRWVIDGGQGARPTDIDQLAFEQYLSDKAQAFPRQLKTHVDDLPSLLEHSYDSLLWEATARRCYSCGSCNLSCPTCYCFNMFDETDVTGSSGSRLREWDGCQLAGFAEVAGGHNFRPKAASRLRHRIYRKAKWIREHTGLPGCVGCARCDRACTAKISSVEIYNQLAEEV